jgi:murein DD-endopeptidase MepM/ murein hydrolase activator NlpD
MKFNYILLSVVVFNLVSCSGITPLSTKKEVPFVEPALVMQHFDIHPGFVKKVEFTYKAEWGTPQIICQLGEGNEIQMATEVRGEKIRSFIAFDYYTEEKASHCQLALTQSEVTKRYDLFHFKIVPYNYIVERINVNRKHVELSEEAIARWQRESEVLKNVYANSIKDRSLFTEPFKLPLKSKMTSPYGTRRVFNDQKDSWHSGIDFRARVGTPIPASNRGVVVVSDDFFFNGKTIIIDHGAGIFTMYCHLSELKAQVGEIVPKGAIIGISGNTGRSSAPHLHWGVRVQNQWINGYSLLEQGI